MTPVIIKNPKKAAPLEQILVSALILLPLFYLIYLTISGQVLHFSNLIANFLIHAALIILPLCWTTIFLRNHIEFYDSEETILEAQTYFSALKQNWWMSLMMWVAPFFSVIVLVTEASHWYRSGLPNWATTPLSAFATLALAFALCFIFGTILRTNAQVRVSEAGLRNGLTNFYEWEKLNNFSEKNGIFALFHQANTALPMTYFKINKPVSREILLKYLANKGIPQVNQDSYVLLVVQISVTLVSVLLVLFAVTLYLNSRLNLRVIVTLIFAASIAATYLLEQFRQIGKITKNKPMIMPAAPEELLSESS